MHPLSCFDSQQSTVVERPFKGSANSWHGDALEWRRKWREGRGGEETVELQIVPVGVFGVDQRVVPARVNSDGCGTHIGGISRV